MGFFDNVICNRKMPDGRDGADLVFQTKMFIAAEGDAGCRLYEITSGGRLRQAEKGFGPGECDDPEHYTGELEFEDNVETYVATFENGLLVHLETLRQRNKRMWGEDL